MAPQAGSSIQIPLEWCDLTMVKCEIARQKAVNAWLDLTTPRSDPAGAQVVAAPKFPCRSCNSIPMTAKKQMEEWS